MSGKIFAAWLLFVPAAWSAIDGTAVNKTSGKAAPQLAITLVKPGQGGMRTLGSTVTDASGHFVFEKDEPGGGPQLLQAVFEGVTYTKLLTPGSPTSGVDFEVFEATKTASEVQVTQQFLIVEPDASKISIGQTVIFANASQKTFSNEQTGTYRFFLPREANGQVRVQVQGPGGMPLPRAAEKTEQRDVFKITYPVRPGETQFEINYTIPAGAPFTFRGQVIPIKGLTMGPLRVIAPAGVTLTGKDLDSVGVEPKTQASIFNTKSAAFSFDITGAGSLHQDAPESAQPDSDSPSVVQGAPKIYEHVGWLAALTLGILAVGLVVLYRTSPVRTPYGE